MKRTAAVTVLVLAMGLLTAAPASAFTPANDNFADATEISSLPFRDFQSDLLATEEVGEPKACQWLLAATVWYRFTPDRDMTLSLDGRNSHWYADFTVWEGTSMGDLEYVTCDSSYWSPIRFDVEAGQTYYIQAGGDLERRGTVAFELSEYVRPDPPLNDDLSDAFAVDPIPYQVTMSNDGATIEPGESNYCAPIGATVWYRFDAAYDTEMSFDTYESSIDTVLGVYTGSGTDDVSLVACNDDDDRGPNGWPYQSRVDIEVQAGTSYLVQVGGYGGRTGQINFNVRDLGLPVEPPPPNDPPANDDLASAFEVDGLPYQHWSTTTSATREVWEPSGCGLINTVWYRFTPTEDAWLLADVDGSGFWPDLGVYSGPPDAEPSDLSLIGCTNYDAQVLDFEAAAGQTYYVQVGSPNGEGDFVLHLEEAECSPGPPPNGVLSGTVHERSWVAGPGQDQVRTAACDLADQGY